MVIIALTLVLVVLIVRTLWHIEYNPVRRAKEEVLVLLG